MTFSPPNAPSAPVPGSGDWTLRRPLAVALVVVLCYVEMALGGLGALIAFILALVAADSSGIVAAGGAGIATIFLGIAVFLGVCGYQIGAGNRTWRAVYIVVTVILSVTSLVQISHGMTALVGPVIGLVSVVLLLLPQSRACFARHV